ncbi:MAG: hypothetical protein ABIO16_05865 [Nocardioides sp.]
MTHHDLAELLRDHVSADEPPAPLPHPAVSAGRRRLRTRRLSAAGAALAVLAVAGAVVGPRVVGNGGPDTAMDPASASALAEYDVHRMPELMDQHVRRVLQQSVPDLGRSTFTAADSQMQDLPEQYWDKASSLSVSFGPEEHAYDVSISHSRGEAEGNPEAYCADGLAAGYDLECTVSRTDDGAVVIRSLEAVKPMTVNGTPVEPESWMAVTQDDLEAVPVAKLYFVHTVKVIKSETLLTYVQERVKATDRDPAAAGFSTSYDDLAAIGTDPVLVMPVPPPGDNGCSQWTLPAGEGGMDVSCE